MLPLLPRPLHARLPPASQCCRCAAGGASCASAPAVHDAICSSASLLHLHPPCRSATPAACASCCPPSCHPSSSARPRVRRLRSAPCLVGTDCGAGRCAALHAVVARASLILTPSASDCHVKLTPTSSHLLTPVPSITQPRPAPQPWLTSAATTSATSCTRAARPACCRQVEPAGVAGGHCRLQACLEVEYQLLHARPSLLVGLCCSAVQLPCPPHSPSCPSTLPPGV